MQNKKDIKGMVVITLKLLVICAVVATLVAAVNFLTKDTIALNKKLKTADALTEISKAQELTFSIDEKGNFVVKDAEGNPAGSCVASDVKLLSDIDAVYVISDNDGNVVSYCVEASPMGFKDEIGMIIAINPDKTVKEVRIISLSDTKGIGDKVMDKKHLAGFGGKTSGFSSNEAELSDMIIAGATRTSKPVAKAVDTALKQIDILTEQDGGEANE